VLDGEASAMRDQSAGYARRSHLDAVADAGSIPAVSIPVPGGSVAAVLGVARTTHSDASPAAGLSLVAMCSASHCAASVRWIFP